MRIAYCTNVRLPSERAHGHQVASVCDALVQIGHEVHIFAPHRQNPIQEDFWTYHEVDRRVEFTHVRSFDGIASSFTPGVLGLKVTTWSYVHKLFPLLQNKNFDLLYTRTPEILSTLLSVGSPVVLELHKLPRRGRSRFLNHCEQCTHIVCLTSAMKRELVLWGIDEKKVGLEGDAVDIERFHHLPEKNNVRDEWKISPEAFVVGYAGSLRTMGLSKGVEQIVAAVTKLQAQGRNVVLLFAGGPEHDGKILAQSPHVFYRGQLPQSEVLKIYGASDLLIYPAPETTHPYFVRDTSPLKIFEYMAAFRPTIVADLPPVRDILDEDAAFFYQPGNVQGLSETIETAMDNPEEAQKRSSRAREIVENHTWENRMKRIMQKVS